MHAAPASSGDDDPVADDDFFALERAGDDAPPEAPGSDLGALGPAEVERLEAKRAEDAERLAQIRDEMQQEDDTLGRQRRQNVRVDVQLPLVLNLLGREAPSRTRDVSATGVGFSTRLPVELEQRGEATISFDGWSFRKAFVIKFVKPILAGSVVGAQFESLTTEERERLVKEVFDIQRTQLQQGRI